MNLAVIGMQFGDEGKGKIVDYLSQDFDVVARFSGGSNAGHTVIYEGNKVKFHLLPSGVLRGKVGVLGNGMAIDPRKLMEELDMIRELNIEPRILVSSRAHVVTRFHRILDGEDDEIIKIGTTRQGIGPCYVAKYRRIGLRIGELLKEEIIERKLHLLNSVFKLNLGDDEIRKEIRELHILGEKMREFVDNTEIWLNRAIDGGKSVLFEGSQGTFLDVDFGTYPYVTSSSTTAGGITQGLGIPPSKIHRVMGITKAYTTRVGGGPFPTEIRGEEGEKLRNRGGEYGATTGRPRRVGYLDLPLLRYAVMLNGIEEVALTKVDVLSGLERVKVGIRYRCNGEDFDLPPSHIEGCTPIYHEIPGWNAMDDENLNRFILFVEREIGAKIKIVSYGADRNSTLVQ